MFDWAQPSQDTLDTSLGDRLEYEIDRLYRSSSLLRREVQSQGFNYTFL